MGSAALQGDLWGRHAQDWAEGNERRVSPLFEAALTALEPLDGLSLLDVGCGSGLVVALATRRGARAQGVDAAEGLIAYARQRTPGANFAVGDMEDLPHPDATFDVVTAFNAIQYASDPRGAVRELARVCTGGGRVVIGVWGDASRCETEVLFARLRELAPPPPGTAAPLAVSAPGVVEELLGSTGLRVDGGGEVPVPFEFADHDEAWTQHTAAGPLQRVIEVAGPTAVRQVLHDVLEADRKPDGALRQDNVMRFVVATKPA